MLGKISLAPEPVGFDPADLFALALLKPNDWPKEYADAHWVWHGSKTSQGHPTVRLGKDIMVVRRVMYCLYDDNPEPRYGVYLKNECNHTLCINPYHQVIIPYDKMPEAPKMAVRPMTDSDVLKDELENIFAMNQPKSLEELMTRPEMEMFDKYEVEVTLKALGLGFGEDNG